MQGFEYYYTQSQQDMTQTYWYLYLKRYKFVTLENFAANVDVSGTKAPT